MLIYIFLSIIGILLMISLMLLIKALNKNSEKEEFIFQLRDQIEHCLDILDENYNTICTVAELEVIGNDPHVMKVVQAVNNSRDSILLIAHKISENFDVIEEIEEERKN